MAKKEITKEFEAKINELCIIIDCIANNAIDDNEASNEIVKILKSLEKYKEMYLEFKDFMKNVIGREITFSRFIADSVNMFLYKNKINAHVKLLSDLGNIEELKDKNIPVNTLAVFIGKEDNKIEPGATFH